MLGRILDDSYASEVRTNVTALTMTRLVANGAQRFSGPFLGVIAGGMHVGLDRLGVAVGFSELSGLVAPATARLSERIGPRASMLVGLGGVTLGAVAASTAHSLVWFGLALLLLGWSKGIFDVGMGSWIARHVPYDRRGRVVGLTETAWALGLLVGVSTMGLLTALTSWRVAFVVVGVVVLAMAVALARRLPADARPAAATAGGPGTAPAAPHRSGAVPAAVGRLDRAGWLAVVGFCALAAASQSLVVTFGTWLKEHHGFSAFGLSAVTFCLGGFELCASLTSAHRTDRWGKERSVIGGALLMVPGILAVIVGNRVLGVGLVGVFVGISAFEFAIVSALAIGSVLVPGSATRGLAYVIAASATGRALAAPLATRLYRWHGIQAPAALAMALAVAGALCYGLRRGIVSAR